MQDCWEPGQPVLHVDSFIPSYPVSTYESFDSTFEKKTGWRGVYVIVSRSPTAVSKVLKTVGKLDMVHASIGFHHDLKELYSFGASDPNLEEKHVGLIKESIHSGIYQDPRTESIVYAIFVPHEDFLMMKSRVRVMLAEEKRFRYSFLGLVTNFFHIEMEQRYRMFCTQFVADIINIGKPVFDYTKLNPGNRPIVTQVTKDKVWIDPRKNVNPTRVPRLQTATTSTYRADYFQWEPTAFEIYRGFSKDYVRNIKVVRHNIDVGFNQWSKRVKRLYQSATKGKAV
jgi:hypothetical protein